VHVRSRGCAHWRYALSHHNHRTGYHPFPQHGLIGADVLAQSIVVERLRGCA
jgi:hypothetical protein